MTRAGTAAAEKAGAGAGALLHPPALILSAFGYLRRGFTGGGDGLLVQY